MTKELMGPPERGPVVTVKGNGIRLCVRVEDDLDREIVRLGMLMSDRRRYGIALAAAPSPEKKEN